MIPFDGAALDHDVSWIELIQSHDGRHRIYRQSHALYLFVLTYDLVRKVEPAFRDHALYL